MACSALTQQAIQRSFSDAVLSRSTECANQDKVSMGLQAALSASEIVSLLTRALATELIALSNAASFRDETKISPASRALLREIRKRSTVLAVRDRPLDADIERLYRWLESGGTAR
jgi:histidine ammonia-lyase